MAVRVVAAWLVSFGLLFQALLPAAGLPSRPDALTLASLCSAAHGDDTPVDSSQDPHAACLALCALIHVAQFVVAPDVTLAVGVLPTRWRRLDLGTDDRLIIVRAATAYSPRAPPAA